MSTSKSSLRKPTTGSAKPVRRRWTYDEKRSIVQESLDDGVVQAKLVRQHGISTSQLYDWRYRYKAGKLVDSTECSEVLVTEETTESDQPSPADLRPDLIVEVGRQYRLTIPAGFDMDAAARFLRGLE